MSVYDEYMAFLKRKSQLSAGHGFAPVWMPEFLFDFQRALVEWAIWRGRAAIFAGCGLGKGQPAESPVLTPAGWVPIGKLTVGDQVIASDGKAYPVTGVYPKPEQDTYRVHFSDGVSYVVDLDHQHICRTNSERQRGKPWRVMSTADLLAVGNIRYGKNGKSRNYDIPVVGNVEFDAKASLPVDPYVLGALLGDGHFKGNIGISSADAQLIADVSDRLPAGVTLAAKSKYDWKVMTGLTGTRCHPFRQAIRDLGLLGKLSADKFIPVAYLFASPTDRLELLRGLMDTDGYIGREGTCQFYSVSNQLADGVMWLVRSLGGVPTRSLKKTSCNGKAGQPCHVVTFSLATHNPFRLERKARRWNPTPRDNGRWIDRIEFERRQPTVCISVASPDNSYVTEHFIVTHNTAMQLVWAENVARHTGKPVLIVSPLGVAPQTVREAHKFGMDAAVSREGNISGRLVVTNYERLHYFDPTLSLFGGVVCDESSAIKAFDGKRRKQVTRFLSHMRYRLLCTATPSPNDYIELGTASEALGELSQSEMLSMFFKASDKQRHSLFREGDFWNREKWFFRAHAEVPFWRWVCSWARALRSPEDLGFDGSKFVLPPLTVTQHVIEKEYTPPGELFPVVARTLKEQRDERKRSLTERCEKVAELVAHSEPAVVWCQYNPEGDLLEELIPDAVQVAGSDTDDHKEGAFNDFATGNVRVLITKPKIGGWGLNWQHCGHQTFFPSHSWEAWHQCLHRSHRFGRLGPVRADVVTTKGEEGVTANLQKKQRKAEKMFASLIREMNQHAGVTVEDRHCNTMEVPSWL